MNNIENLFSKWHKMPMISVTVWAHAVAQKICNREFIPSFDEIEEIFSVPRKIETADDAKISALRDYIKFTVSRQKSGCNQYVHQIWVWNGTSVCWMFIGTIFFGDRCNSESLSLWREHDSYAPNEIIKLDCPKSNLESYYPRKEDDKLPRKFYSRLN